ncbi:MAG: FGGY family carbohydrate kinase [bacterium]
MKTFLAAIDCGTSVVKSAVVGVRGEIKGFAGVPTPCVQYADGRIENDPQSIVNACFSSLRLALAKSGISPKHIEGISLANQRATLLCVDVHGRELGNAISWQDMRGAARIKAFRRHIPDKTYCSITGLPNNPVFTLAKILWIMKHDPDRFRKTAHFVLIQDYVLKQLGCDGFFCDWSNASLTGMLDVERLSWSPTILKLTGIPEARLSDLVPSGTKVGTLSKQAARRTGLLEGTPLVAGGGDQQCAGIGAGAVAPGMIEITLGTAAVPLCYTATAVRDPKRRVMCCAHAVPGKWNLEGLQNSAGVCLRWAAMLMNGGERFSNDFLAKVADVGPGAAGILFYPYLAGDSAPHWNPGAKGMFMGLTLTHNRYELARAVMEGVSMQTREVLDVFTTLGVPIRQIRLTGGCTAIEGWNQMQADIFGKPVSTLENPQASLLGAAILAAHGVGIFPSVASAAKQMVRIRRTYEPARDRVGEYDSIYRKFRAIRGRCEAAHLFAASERPLRG